MLALDPDTPLALGLVIAALSLCAGALATALLLSAPPRGRARRRAVAPAFRRGSEVTAVVGLLLLLRVMDGLTAITAAFVVLGFATAEIILSARRGASSR